MTLPSKLDAISPGLLSIASLRSEIKCHDAGYQISRHNDHYSACYPLIGSDRKSLAMTLAVKLVVIMISLLGLPSVDSFRSKVTCHDTGPHNDRYLVCYPLMYSDEDHNHYSVCYPLIASDQRSFAMTLALRVGRHVTGFAIR